MALFGGHPVGCEDDSWHGFYEDTAADRFCADFHPSCGGGGGGHLALVEAGVTDFQDLQAVEGYLSRYQEYVEVSHAMNHILVHDCAGIPLAVIAVSDRVAESLRSNPASRGGPESGTGEEVRTSGHQARGYSAQSPTR